MKLSDQNWQDAGRIYEKTLARELDEMLEERDREREDDYGKNGGITMIKDPVLEVLSGLLLARCVLEDAYDVADWKYKKDLLYLMRDIDNLSETVKEMEDL